ncbi:MAG: hypothetical protein ACRDLF_09020 [Solirubrobacteraceae bacterium]
MGTRRANRKLAKALAALGALAAVAAGGVAVSGCGASATLDPIARAAEVTSQQAGARIKLTMQLSSPALPSGYSITANGYFDERNRSGEMSMDLSNIPGASALPGGGAGTVQMVFQYPVIYMDMPFLAGKLPEGKTWMKLDLTKAAQAAGIDLSQLSSLNQSDPTQFLEYLRASSGGVVKVGSEPADGVPTTHYQATLQLSSILGRLPASAQAAAKAALEQLGNAGAIPVDVWVDAQGRVRRMQLTIAANVPAGTDGGAPGAATGVSSTITIDFTSYGPVPPVVPPPAGEVFDASAMAAAGIADGQGG